MTAATYFEVPARGPLGVGGKLGLALRSAALTPLYWALAHRAGTPGLDLQVRAFRLALRTMLAARDQRPLRELVRLVAYPLDSVRYFELDFVWRALATRSFERYLDVSSPRLLPVLLLEARPLVRAELVNPDGRDLAITRRLLRAAGLDGRCRLHQATATDAPLTAGGFEVVTSVSVVEHIADDTEAVRAMWSLLAPGGRLFVSVPCAAEARDEYVDRDFYGVAAPRAGGYTFFQRFYDERALEERIFSVTGPPARSAVFGEKRAGLYHRNTHRRMADPRYPIWREAYAVGEQYRPFGRPGELPGVGVIALELVKP